MIEYRKRTITREVNEVVSRRRVRKELKPLGDYSEARVSAKNKRSALYSPISMYLALNMQIKNLNAYWHMVSRTFE